MESRSRGLVWRGCALLAACSLCACTGEPRMLPPREPPPRSAPDVPFSATPVPEGRTRLVLTTTDGPMKITARADTEFVPPGTNAPPTRMGELCTTPCVVDLPPGQYKLYLNAADGTGDVDTFTLRPATGVTYYARAPGRFESPRWPLFASVLIGTGVALLATGAILASSPSAGSSGQAGGYALLVGGGAFAIVGGALWYDSSRGSTREGATTVWSEPSR